MRSFHRYASDALVLVVVLHLTREYILERLHGPRWFAWTTGVAAAWLILAAGITGYWIVWDKLAQLVAITSTEWIDVLPLFGEPIARNFLHSAALNDRFFTLMVFIHIAVPLALLLVMWLHIHRHVGARVNPAGGLAYGCVLGLLVLAILQPALSQGPPNLDRAVDTVQLDWFYLWLLPLTSKVSGLGTWVGVVAGTLVLLALPFITARKKARAAVIDLDNCNGCGRCRDDCPFGAIEMGTRTDGKAYKQQAVVNPSQCLSCGICTGSCPTATPFRTRSSLIAGIEQPALTSRELRDRCLTTVEKLHGPVTVLVFGCGHGAELERVADNSVGVVELPCVGMLPPTFIDFLLSRDFVDGIVLTGCRGTDCYYRHGIRWTVDRLEGRRDPRLRQRVARQRIETAFVGLAGEHELRVAVDELKKRLQVNDIDVRSSAAR